MRPGVVCQRERGDGHRHESHRQERENSAGAKPGHAGVFRDQPRRRIPGEHEVERPVKRVDRQQQGREDEERCRIAPTRPIEPADQEPQARGHDDGAQGVGARIGRLKVEAMHGQASECRKPRRLGVDQTGGQTGDQKERQAHRQRGREPVHDLRRAAQDCGRPSQRVVDRNRGLRLRSTIADHENREGLIRPEARRKRHEPKAHDGQRQ
jgi:hypothetical protein